VLRNRGPWDLSSVVLLRLGKNALLTKQSTADICQCRRPLAHETRVKMSLVTRRDQDGFEVTVSNLHKKQGFVKDIPLERNIQELIRIVAVRPAPDCAILRSFQLRCYERALNALCRCALQSSKKLSITKDDACFHLWCLATNEERQVIGYLSHTTMEVPIGCSLGQIQEEYRGSWCA